MRISLFDLADYSKNIPKIRWPKLVQDSVRKQYRHLPFKIDHQDIPKFN